MTQTRRVRRAVATGAAAAAHRGDEALSEARALRAGVPE